MAALVEDGSTLQVGIGSVPDATLALLKNKLDLGIHTKRVFDFVHGNRAVEFLPRDLTNDPGVIRANP